jgi:hypothetical protein
MSDFTGLLADLEELRKASDPTDKKAKAKDGDADCDDAADDRKIEAAAKDGEKQSDKDKDGETFGKAFKVKLEDGTETEAFDGTEMLKALHAEHEGLRQTVDTQQDDILKAFGMAVTTIRELRTQVAEQSTMLKALQGKVETMGAAGVGRRTMLTIAEKLSPSAGVSGESTKSAGPTPGQVLMKAQFMARKGDLDWGLLPRIEAHQGRGSLAPDDLLQRYPELLTPVP